MRHPAHVLRGVFAAALAIGYASSAAAQVARVSGMVKGDGQPIKGATIRADNPDAALSTITAATDDKGRFAIIGLARGTWTFTAEAPGFQSQFAELNIQRVGTPNPPLMFSLQKAIVRPAAGVEGVTAKELQQQLNSANDLFGKQKYREAIGVYQGVLSSAPSLSVVQLQIAAAYRALKEYDRALASYNDLLKADPSSEQAYLGIAMVNLEKGDAKAAEETLTRATETLASSSALLYHLAEIKLANNQPDEAARLYRRAAEADASWGKPLLKLGTIAMNKGDRATAVRTMEQVIKVDPTSPEAAQARKALDQLR